MNGSGLTAQDSWLTAQGSRLEAETHDEDLTTRCARAIRRRRSRTVKAALVIAALVSVAQVPGRLSAGDPGGGDWPMWGGTPDRNMVSAMKGLPAEWDVKTKKNVKWVADLGSQSYGNPVVAGGMVFVGTNNELVRDKNQGGDRGVLMAFRESDGEFLWQQTHVKLESGRANDWPFQGVASSPLVEDRKLYYVSNRGVLLCLDIDGFRDNENDGAGEGREADRPVRRRRHLVVRHDGRGRHLSAQPRQLVAGHPRQPDLRLDLERAGREPRQRPVAARAGDHRGRQEHRQAGVGRQLGRRPHSARPVVDPDGRHDRRRPAGRVGTGRRLGARLRSGDRQEAVGVRHQSRRTRSGRGRATRSSPRRSSTTTRSTRQRPGPRAR